jgi:hypothetical protein
MISADAIQKAQAAVDALETELDRLLDEADRNPNADASRVIWCRQRLEQAREDLDLARLQQQNRRYG